MKKIFFILSTSFLCSFSLFAHDLVDEWEELSWEELSREEPSWEELSSEIFNGLQTWNKELAARDEDKENDRTLANLSSPAPKVTFGKIEIQSKKTLAHKQKTNSEFDQLLHSLKAVFDDALELTYDSEQYAHVRDFFIDQSVVLSKIKHHEFGQIEDQIHFYASGTIYKRSLINFLKDLSGHLFKKEQKKARTEFKPR